MSRRSEPRPCPAADCTAEITGRVLFCETHTHLWIAAAEVPLDNGRVAGAVRRNAAELKEGTWVKVLDVYCSTCRQNFLDARDTACNPYSSVLRGGPLGTRRKRTDADEATTGP